MMALKYERSSGPCWALRLALATTSCGIEATFVASEDRAGIGFIWPVIRVDAGTSTTTGLGRGGSTIACALTYAAMVFGSGVDPPHPTVASARQMRTFLLIVVNPALCPNEIRRHTARWDYGPSPLRSSAFESKYETCRA